MGPGQKAYPVKKKHIAEGPALTGRPFCQFGQDIDGSRRRDWAAKKPDIIGLFAGDIFFVSTLWCEGGDLNPHVVRHTHLKRACLPVPAPSHIERCLVYHFRLNSSTVFCANSEKSPRQGFRRENSAGDLVSLFCGLFCIKDFQHRLIKRGDVRMKCGVFAFQDDFTGDGYIFRGRHTGA